MKFSVFATVSGDKDADLTFCLPVAISEGREYKVNIYSVAEYQGQAAESEACHAKVFGLGVILWTRFILLWGKFVLLGPVFLSYSVNFSYPPFFW